MTNNVRVVLDTNVMVSAALLPRSTPRRAFDQALEHGAALISLATLAELNEVLRSPRFNGYLREVNPMPRKPSRKSTNVSAATAGEPVLLSGGNPQIAKADGDAPVQAYIAAMPGWKSDVGRRIDDLIVRTVPDVRKAVRWNSPWYGIEEEGWFLSCHVFTHYVKVTFLNGASLSPVPPGSGKDPDSRWIDIYEGKLDEEQMAEWVRQAAALPGWHGF